MFKFLRKYNKVLLAVFGVLLMITFLIPQAIEQFGRQSGMRRATVATVGDGEKVTQDSWQIVQRELQFLQRVGPSFAAMGVRVPIVEAAQRMKPEHWFLLTREAERSGMISTGAAIGLTNDALFNLAQLSQERDLEFIRNTLAKLFGVEQMMSMHNSGGLFSDRRLLQESRQLLHMATAQLVVIDAQPEGAPEPTESQIQSHFEKFADVVPGSGEEEFGYRLPNRVKLEWLHIAPDSVRASVQQSPEFSTIAQRTHWRRFENDPAKKFPPAPRNEAADVPDIVRNDLLETLTNQKLDEIAKYAADQLRLNRRGIPERDGYVVLPDDWNSRKLNFNALATSIQSQFKVDLPAYESTGDRWTPVNEVAEIAGIGKATTDKFGSSPMSLSQLVEQCREIDADGHAPISIQKDIAGPPLKGADKSVYVFRIIDTDAARKPHSADEVREQIVRDLKRQANYQQLANRATELEQLARTEGMLAVALNNNTTLQKTTSLSLANRYLIQQFAQYGLPVEVSPTEIPGLGRNRKAVESILQRALAMPDSTSFVNMPEEQRTFVLPVPERLALVVVRLMNQNPLTNEEFATLVQANAIQRLLASEQKTERDALKGPFGFDALAKRNNFKFVREAGDEELPENAAANAG